MSKRPLSERTDGDEEEEDLGLRGGATKKTRVDGESNEAAGEFSLLNVMVAITDVSNWRDLGLQLGLSSSRLNEIEQQDNPKQKMIIQWMKEDDASWEKLQEALTTPAMCENRVAKGIADRRGSSFDRQSILEIQSKCSTFSDIDASEDFTEANVRNKIVSIKNIRVLGEKLQIPPSQLECINKLPIESQKQKLVELWFKVDIDCNWKTLDTAIRSMKVLEWRTSKSMSDSFTDTLTSPSQSCTSSFSEAMITEDFEFLKVAETKNISMIKRLYFRLKRTLAKKLTDVVDDMDDFHQYILDLFDAGDTIQKPSTVREVFDRLTEKKYWSFTDVSKLESIVEEYGGRVETECLKLIDDYKEDLKGFKTAIKIVEFTEGHKNTDVDGNGDGQYTYLREEKETYDAKYRTKLSIMLAGDNKRTSAKISLESLYYVEKLWNSLCFDFNLPSLPHVLDNIINGSIIIHWIVEHKLTWRILEQIGDSVKFFEREVITNVSLEGVCVYNQKRGIRVQKICYVKLLVTVQEGKEVEKSFIQECFPDIDAPVDELGRTALLLAARHGHTILMKPLLGNGADIYHRDKEGKTALIMASARGHESVVRPLLEMGNKENINYQIEDTQWNALFFASKESHHGVVKLLLEYGADINLSDSNEMTVLMISTNSGCIEIASALLEHGADMNKQDVSGWSALFHAVSEGHLDMVRRLLEDEEDDHHEADLTLRDVTGSTVLDLALKCGHSEIHNTLKTELDNHLVIHAKKGDLSSVEQFLEMGANVDATDPIKDQWTSLTWASWRGYLDIVNHLLKCDANVNVTSGTGFSPLILSSREGHCEVMKSLLYHGANVELKTKKGWSSLMMTADFGWVEAGKLLLEHGADMNCLTSNNNTPLSIACQNGKHDFVRMLIEENPDLELDEVPKGSWTPLMLACRRGHLETVKVLLEKGADVDKAKEDSIGPLHIASFEGYNEVVNFLIHMNVDTNVADCCDVTPLMMTIKEGHFRAFKALISDSRTNLNLQEKNVKHSAVFFAVNCNRLEMLDSLLKSNRLDLGIRDIGGYTVMEYAEKNNPEAFSFLQKNHVDKFEQVGVSHKRQQQVTYKELASRVAEMMQGMDIRMGRKVAASAA